MIISENFIKDIPGNKKEIVLRKLKTFENCIKEFHSVNDIQKGFWIRKVKGTDIFKFRINNGDRVLFFFDKKREGSKVIFFRYCNHDEQIRMAREYNRNVSNSKVTEFDPDYNEYIEDEIDQKIDTDLESFIVQHSNPDLEQLSLLIVEDEYIALLLDENNEDFLYYLSEDQFKCIEAFGKPVLLSGCAGSGKSMVGLRKLLLCTETDKRNAYFSYNRLLVENAGEYFNKFKREEQDAEFYSINDFCLKYSGIEPEKLVLFHDFEKWIDRRRHLSRFIKGYSAEQVWSEIFGLIKGYQGNHWGNRIQRMLKFDEYLETKYSNIDKADRHNIYKIAELYQKWLEKEDLYDENDIAYNSIQKLLNEQTFKFDFLVIDEIQDMSETQILLLYMLAKHPQNIFMIGDMNQVVCPGLFSVNRIKDLLSARSNIKLEEAYLAKNYRNVSGIVNMLNALAALRIEHIGKNKYDKTEIYIRDGDMPVVTPYNAENIRELVNRADNTDYCAVVVGNTRTREQLRELGCATGRVFTVDEVKGLEYRNVICYNIVSDMSNEWETIISGNAYGNDYYRIFFNKLYIAFTRARDTLCIVENEKAKVLFDKLKDYYTGLSEFSIKVLDFTKVSTVNDWLKEAKKLETAGLYLQAIHAYEKAGCNEGVEHCRKLLDFRDKKAFNYQKSFAIRVESEDKQPLNGNIIKMALNKICRHFKVSLDNYAQIIISYNREDLGIKTIDFYTDDRDEINHKLAMFIEKTYKSEKGLNQKKVTIHICLRTGDGINTDKYFENDQFDTIIAANKNTDIFISTRTTQSAGQEMWKKTAALINSIQEAGLDEEVFSSEDFNESMHILSDYANSNKLKEGIDKVEKLIAKRRVSARISAKLYAAICQICFNNNLYANTLEYAKKGIAYNPEDFELYNLAGVALLNLGEPENAKEYFEKSLSINGDYKVAYSNLELAKKNIEDKKAKGYAKKTLTKDGLEEIYKAYDALYESGKYDECIIYLYYVIDYYFMNNKLESGLYTMVAECYNKMNDRKNACKCINLALEKDPLNSSARELFQALKAN